MSGATTTLDLTQVVAALASGDMSSTSLLEQSLGAIDECNGSLNIYTHVDAAGSRAAAQASDARRANGKPLSALDGVPAAIKANIAVQGWVHTAGLQVYRSRIAAEDSAIVRRLRALGAIPVGATNMDEAALGAATMNPWFGVTQNPRCMGRSTGGSSGGSAAALAAFTLPLAIGTDTIGSVRIPASYCGVTALKPSHGLLSVRGVEPVHLRFDHVGPMARTAHDLAIVMPLLAGQGRMSDAASGSSSSDDTALRIGYATRLDALGVTADVQAAYDEALERLRGLGFDLIPVDVAPWDLVRIRRAVFSLCEMELWRRHRDTLASRPELYSTELYDLLAYGGRLTGKDVDRFEQRLTDFGATIDTLFASVDLFATPTTLHTAFAHAEAHPQNGADLTCIASATGLPAIAMPLRGAQTALPASLQLMGRRGRDVELIRVAEKIESQELR